MTKNQNETMSVGDSKSPPLKPTEIALRNAADSAMQIPAACADPVRLISSNNSLAGSLKGQTHEKVASGTCLQTLWFSFFFDGTGNNLDADVGTNKHSNIAKLFRAHTENDTSQGIYRLYVPGVGTYFKEVGDDGGSKRGLGMGAEGDVRIEWAIKQYDKMIAPHIARAKNQSNEIVEINVAVFGFSRGAAMARAFTNDFLKQRCKEKNGKWQTLSGHKIRFRFLGLLDTVASSGLPMSANNIDTVTIPADYQTKVYFRLRNEEIRHESLAFEKAAAPGADPAPGNYDGHAAYGGKMAIPEMVEEVRHYIAAHEIRNSFPVESVWTLKDGRLSKPTHFFEYVYPGVHSDVGGSYRPGEGARSNDPINKLGLIPLHHLYKSAMDAQVPLMPKSAWTPVQEADFEMGKEIVAAYTYYLAKIPKSNSLGQLINSNMGLYFAWRFRDIKRKLAGDNSEAKNISKIEATYRNEDDAFNKQIAELEKKDKLTLQKIAAINQRKQAVIQSNYGNPNVRRDLAGIDAELMAAERERAITRDDLLRAKAKKDALPPLGTLQEAVNYYDARLLEEAKDIYEKYGPSFWSKSINESKRRKLRPHYLAMMNAYENEFIRNNGLKDEKIIGFFDHYVHDSLAGFATDATLPSDPRVVYVGGDEKLKYAFDQRGQQQELEIA